MPVEPVLVGRDEEIKQLTRCFDSALNGKGATVFVYGEVGVGKTRLVNEFLALAKKRGARILPGWCLSEAAVPYFPFTEAFNTYVATIKDGKTKSTMEKELGITGWLKGSQFAKAPTAVGLLLTPEIERDKTFEAVASTFLQLSAQEPLILFLDDLQWADHLSLALLHYLARKCKNSRLLIVGTYRVEELIHTKEERLHPLEKTMFAMSREDLLITMELKRLKRNDLPEFFRSMFGFSVDEEFVEKLYKETEGNPLFAVETLNLIVEEGFLSEKAGRWTLSAPLEKIGIPSKIHEVITQRIARLEREERKLLDLAAVCGHNFNPDTLSKALALDITDVLGVLAEVEQRHRLIRSEDSTFEFTHHKIREVVCKNIPSELRRVYHLKTASCLEQVLVEESDGYISDIAFHYVEGGAPEKAFKYLVKLGEKAVKIYANVQAVEYLDKALEAVQKAPSLGTSDNLAKMYRLRGRAWLGQDQRAKARDDFNLMLQSAANISDESMIAEAHYSLGLAYEAYAGEMDEAMRHLTVAVELARKTGNKRLEAKVLGAIGYTLMWGTNPDTMNEGREQLEESSRLAKEIGDKVTEASNLCALGMYYNWKGEFQQAKRTFNETLALDREAGVPPGIVFDSFCLGMALAGNGEYNEAISTLQRELQTSRDSGFVSYACMILNTLGWIYHELSNIELAIKHNNEALEVAKAHQISMASGAVPSSLLNLGMDYLYKSDYENAEKYFKEVFNAYEQHRPGWWRIETRILLGRGEVALARGDCGQALELAEDSLLISQKADAKKYIAKGLKLKAEILAKMGSAEESIKLMEEALHLAQKLGNPPLLWQTHYSLGVLLEKQGTPEKANEHYARAIALIEETASRLEEKSLRNTLLSAPQTKTIQDAYAKTRPAS